MSLGTTLRRARKNEGLTLRALARQLGIHFVYVWDIENGRRVPDESVLAAYAKRFGLPMDDLLLLSGRMTKRMQSYIGSHPTAIEVIRAMVARRLTEKRLMALLAYVRRV